jgi:hypothetical protein
MRRVPFYRIQTVMPLRAGCREYLDQLQMDQ